MTSQDTANAIGGTQPQLTPSVPRGYLALFGRDNTDFENAVAQILKEVEESKPIPEACLKRRSERDGESAGHHLTILTKLELHPYMIATSKANPTSLISNPLPASIRTRFTDLPLVCLLGIAQIHTHSPVYFIPALYPSATLLRRRLNLPPHPFHVTLGFAKQDETDPSERAWTKLTWLHRDGKAARTMLEGCEEVLKSLSGKADMKEAETVVAETVIELCTLLLDDPEWTLTYMLSDPTNGEMMVGDTKQTLTDLLCLRSRMRGKLRFYQLSLFDALDAFNLLPASTLVCSRVAAAHLALGEKIEAAKYITEGLSLSSSDPLLLQLATRAGVDPSRIQKSEASSASQPAPTSSTTTFPIKFPRTPHLLALSPSISRDDLVLAPQDTKPFLSPRTVTLEEKIDGANLGITLVPDGTFIFRNRGKIITEASATQWGGLGRWSEGPGGRGVRGVLERVGGGAVVFGEWMWAVHGVEYDGLPGWFVLFDIWEPVEGGSDSEHGGVRGEKKRRVERDGVYEGGRFWSARRRDELVRSVCDDEVTVPVVPCIARDVVLRNVRDIVPFMDRISAYGKNKIEGVYVRLESEDGMWLERRAKVVAADFVQAIEEGGHWSKKIVKKNGLKS
ncbi:hypothetical protein HDV00_009499 [Rhizophlyctis rosea]|nr:hypothetical protein HDV00_009499 [Rhizophlyctis rosea]